MSEEAIKEEGPRAFAEFLRNVADGHAHVELSTELQRLGKLLRDHAQAVSGVAKGKLSIVFDLKVDATGVCGVNYNITTKEPAKPRRASVFWTTKEGNLSAQNPRQTTLPLVDVNKPAPPARDVNAEVAP